ncbi:MAG: serine/threonine-protein kinase [Isosphaeraceae bacterium]
MEPQGRERPTLGEPPVSVTGLMQVDSACDRFEEDCREGRTPNLAAYLAGVPETVQARLLRELLGLDCEYRRRRGERADAAFYRERFPEHVDVVDSVFRSRTVASVPGRSAEPGGDTRRIVSPAEGRAGELEERGHDDLRSAGYEVIRLLGRGGMGVVYEAKQIALDRLVAIKLVRSGSFASESEIVRFRNEAEAVAQLDHPHIVPIHEVGSFRGRPFFSMKRIAGSSLDRKLAEYAEDPRGSARLVAIVASAIHHAHQRGILHRDLKPANILIDEAGAPHVTDFGLAKRIDGGDGQGDSELTHSGMLVGTPSYMAPEQTTRSLGAVSTATDVYGLGTILYAMLAGRAPFTGTTLVDTLDLVRTQYPEPPSRLNPRVPRDLEVICRKCLEKEPARRYPSAQALADDLERWLRGEPIEARPVGPVVRGWMWCRRNKLVAAAAMLALASLIGGLAGVTWKWREAERERARSEGVVAFLTRRLFGRADHELVAQGRDPSVRQMLDDAAATLGGWLDGQPDVEAQVRETIGGAYLSLGQYKPAEAQLKQAIELAERSGGPDDRVVLRGRGLLGTLLGRTGRGGESEELLRRDLADGRRVLGALDPVTLDVAERLGEALWHLGRLDEAEAILRQNLLDRERVFRPEHPETLRSVFLLSRLLLDRSQFKDAKDLAYRYAHDIQCVRGTNHPDRIIALRNQGDVARAAGRRDEALVYYRQAAVEAGRILGDEHPATRAAQANLAAFVGAAGETAGQVP